MRFMGSICYIEFISVRFSQIAWICIRLISKSNTSFTILSHNFPCSTLLFNLIRSLKWILQKRPRLSALCWASARLYDVVTAMANNFRKVCETDVTFTPKQLKEILRNCADSRNKQNDILEECNNKFIIWHNNDKCRDDFWRRQHSDVAIK